MRDTDFLKAAAFFSGLSEKDLEKIAGMETRPYINICNCVGGGLCAAP